MIKKDEFMAISAKNEPKDAFRCIICDTVLENRISAVQHVAKTHVAMA